MELAMLCSRILFIMNVNGNGNGLFQTIKLEPINLALLDMFLMNIWVMNKTWYWVHVGWENHLQQKLAVFSKHILYRTEFVLSSLPL